MPNENQKRSANNNKKHDKKFRSKHVSHAPGSESARAKFGLNGEGRNGG